MLGSSVTMSSELHSAALHLVDTSLLARCHIFLNAQSRAAPVTELPQPKISRQDSSRIASSNSESESGRPQADSP